jgi:hypothetical protein
VWGCIGLFGLFGLFCPEKILGKEPCPFCQGAKCGVEYRNLPTEEDYTLWEHTIITLHKKEIVKMMDIAKGFCAQLFGN